jgi:hypothetical protein
MESSPRRSLAWPWVLGASLVAAVILVANLVVADWISRTGEVAQLVRDIKVSESVMTKATDGMSAAIEAAGESPTPEAQQKLLDDLRKISVDSSAELRLAGAKVISLRLFPWQRAVWNAREAYVSHNAAWQAFFDDGAEDPQSLFTEHPDIESTWLTVVETLPLAVPRPDPYDLAERVNAIVVEGSESDSGTSAEPGTPALFLTNIGLRNAAQ